MYSNIDINRWSWEALHRKGLGWGLYVVYARVIRHGFRCSFRRVFPEGVQLVYVGVLGESCFLGPMLLVTNP